MTGNQAFHTATLLSFSRKTGRPGTDQWHRTCSSFRTRSASVFPGSSGEFRPRGDSARFGQKPCAIGHLAGCCPATEKHMCTPMVHGDSERGGGCVDWESCSTFKGTSKAFAYKLAASANASFAWANPRVQFSASRWKTTFGGRPNSTRGFRRGR